MEKKQKKHHGIDDQEHMTDQLTGCGKYFAVRAMLNHAASSLPAGSFAHDNCRRNPPKLKIQLHLSRTVKHNIKVFKKKHSNQNVV